MRTKLSVNINKIALLRNARGRNYPDVLAFAEQFLQLGADGITLHPRPDERHARFSDCAPLQALCAGHGKELNIEGYPSPDFIALVLATRPAQCTLVPDSPAQITSDHGWDLQADAPVLAPAIAALKQAGIRVSLFVDYNNPHIAQAAALGADCIELYTEPYAENYSSEGQAQMLQGFATAATAARQAGLSVNAGHDLNLGNLAAFLSSVCIDEVSIGHALIVECLQCGIAATMAAYTTILSQSPLVSSRVYHAKT